MDSNKNYFISLFLFLFLVQKILSLEEYSLPEEYDLRIEYKECKSLNLNKNQKKLNESWAFALAGLISDKICINSNGKDQPILSEAELLTCNKGEINKINSGFIYSIIKGLSTESCKTYNKISNYSNIKCSNNCSDNSKQKKYFISDYKLLDKEEKHIMNEIYFHGPVIAQFRLYSDFYDFMRKKNKDEIYELNPGSEFIGYHTIKIIGWGEKLVNEKNVTYWICANSLGNDDINDGFFKIIRGENYLDIESYVYNGYINSKILHRNKDDKISFEGHFFNFNNLNKDFM